MRILLVEDDSQLVASLSEALVVQRYIVDSARDGESAWDNTQAIVYDLILMDVTLPKLDGVRLCQRLRAAIFLPFSCLPPAIQAWIK